MVAQSTINTLNAVTRNNFNEYVESYKEDKIAINYAGAINISAYLKQVIIS